MRVSKRVMTAGLFAISASGVANSAMATVHIVSGVPAHVWAMSSYRTWDDAVELTGLTSIPNTSPACAVDGQTGLVSIQIKKPSATDFSGNRLWALALAAMNAGQSITIAVDDGIRDSSNDCYAIWIYM